MLTTRLPDWLRPRTLAAILLAGAAPALGQAAQRAAFVANNGNLEGSITSFTFSPSGAPVFVSRVITGVTPSTSTGNLGQNPYAISLSPNGRWVATSHATASNVLERVMIFEVAPDASLTTIGTFDTPDSPLDCEWATDEYLAVTRTRTSGVNEVILYRYSPAQPPAPATLVEVDRQPTGNFTSYLAVHPNRELLFTADSSLNTIRTFRVGAGGTLTLLADNPVGLYPLGPGVSRDGLRIYAGAGISGGSNKITGHTINVATGALTAIPGSPFISPGSNPSPKLAVSSSDDRFVFVGHGSSSEIRSFAVDPNTGALTDTGFAFDVGIQGELGDAAVLGNLLLVSKNFLTPTGLYAFTINPNGSFTMNGGLVSTQGTAPRGIAVWNPPESCYPDCNGDGALNLADFGCFQTRFALQDPYADCNGDGMINLADFGCFQTRFALGCP